MAFGLVLTKLLLNVWMIKSHISVLIFKLSKDHRNVHFPLFLPHY